MTVQKELTKNIYVGNGQTTKFPFTFECPDNHPEYIRVYVAGKKNELTETTNFGVDMANKSITYPANGEPLAIDEQLVIMRELPVRQLMNLVNNGPYFAEDIETAFDEGIMIAQQSSEKLGRALVAPPTSTTFDTQIPIEPGKTFRISDDGTHLESTEDPGKVYEASKGFAEAAATSATNAIAANKEAQQANEEVKQIYNNGMLTPISDLAGSIGTELKRWGTIFANKVFASNLPLMYNSVADMKSDRKLKAGMTACTLGYYSPNDGGAGTYIIRAKQDGDVDDGGSLHEISGKLVAELVVENGTVCPEQFGAKGDGVSDDYNNLKTLVDYAELKAYIVRATKKYKIEQQLNINCDFIMSYDSYIVAGVALENVVGICDKYNAVTIKRQSKTIKINVDANELGNTAIVLYYPARCNLDLYGLNFNIYGVNLGGQSAGNDENTINIKYTGKKDGTSFAGIWLHGSDNNIQELYGHNTKYGVYVSDASIYSINILHVWTSLDSIANNGAIFCFHEECRVHINLLYQDTYKYLIDGKHEDNKYSLFLSISALMPFGQTAFVIYHPEMVVKMAQFVNITNLYLTQPLSKYSIECPNLTANPLQKFVTVTNFPNKNKLILNMPEPNFLPINSNICTDTYLYETKGDACGLVQTRTHLTTGKISRRFRLTWTEWSTWTELTSSADV